MTGRRCGAGAPARELMSERRGRLAALVGRQAAPPCRVFSDRMECPQQTVQLDPPWKSGALAPRQCAQKRPGLQPRCREREFAATRGRARVYSCRLESPTKPRGSAAAGHCRRQSHRKRRDPRCHPEVPAFCGPKDPWNWQERLRPRSRTLLLMVESGMSFEELGFSCQEPKGPSAPSNSLFPRQIYFSKNVHFTPSKLG